MSTESENQISPFSHGFFKIHAHFTFKVRSRTITAPKKANVMRCVTWGLAMLTVCTQSYALSELDSRNLLERTGFTPSFSEVDEFTDLSYVQAIDKILDSTTTEHFVIPPQGIRAPEDPPSASASDQEKQSYRKKQRELAGELQVWWLNQMLTTSSPLTEQMVLFWHNHFVSSISKVKSPVLMYRQNQLFRDHAFGNYRDLVQRVSKDPAMILYLDNQSNRKSAPNENYARELFELFTLGEGAYSETDIKEAARAFTGWQVQRRSGDFYLNVRQHDAGVKTVFGHTGNWNGDQVIDLIFDEKGNQAAQYLVEKLYRHFVSEQLNSETVAELTTLFVTIDFEIAPLLRALFLSEDFRHAMSARNLVKSPVDLVVGTQRSLGLAIANPGLVQQMGRNMNQALFAPPSVEGWPGGTQWITSSTLLARTQLMGQVTKAVADAVVMQSKDYDQLLRYSPAQWSMLLSGDSAFMNTGSDSEASLLKLDEVITTVLQGPRFQIK